MKETEKERQMIRSAAEKTAQRIVQPRAAKIDATGEFPRDLMDAFGRQGFLSLLLPESYGGNDGDLTSFCIVVEEIAKVCGSSSLVLLAQGSVRCPSYREEVHPKKISIAQKFLRGTVLLPLP